MIDLYPTKTRLALLARVADRGVYREVDTGRDVECRSERSVSNALYVMAAAGWVELESQRWCRGGTESDVRFWRLTDAGRGVLDDAPGGAS